MSFTPRFSIGATVTAVSQNVATRNDRHRCPSCIPILLSPAASAQPFRFEATHIPYHKVLPSARQVVNAGSVGKPKDGDPRACYIVLEAQGQDVLVDFVRVPYDIERAAQAIEASDGMPREYAQMLRAGKGLPQLSQREHPTLFSVGCLLCIVRCAYVPVQQQQSPLQHCSSPAQHVDASMLFTSFRSLNFSSCAAWSPGQTCLQTG